MKLIAYRLRDGAPEPRPGRPTREWMDQTAQKYAYRCLPLRVANTHGWEICADAAFEARWDGADDIGGVQIRARRAGFVAPASHFGHGVLTIQFHWLFRTEPRQVGLWVTAAPNWPKDGLAPLSGLVETAWAPFTFTMNWKFTRPGKWVRFEEGEPICFFFPIDYVAIETASVETRAIEDDAELHAAHTAWKASRNEFNACLAEGEAGAVARKWQRDYFTGRDPFSGERPELHRFKASPAAFTPHAKSDADEI